MPTFICRTWTGNQAELDAGSMGEAAKRFAEGSFGDYPREICCVWVTDKECPGVSECISVAVPDQRPEQAGQPTEQEHCFIEWVQGNVKDPENLFDDDLFPPERAADVARRILEDTDFTNEVEPGIVPIELDAQFSRSGKTETFLWRLAGWREKESEPTER